MKSISLHHTNPKYYNEAYNRFVLRDFRVNSPTGDRIEKGFYESWESSCTCHTNRHRETLFPLHGTERLLYYQFATCPLNTLAAILGRQCASKLFPEPNMLSKFSQFVSKHWIMELKNHYQKVSMSEYLAHVAMSDPGKAKKYLTAYAKF